VKGFTLLEVLVSVSILAVIMASLYGAYTSNVEAIQLVRQGSEVHQVARIVLDRMARDLESIIVGAPTSTASSVLGLIAEDREIDGKPADRLDFTTLTHLAFAEGEPLTDLCEVGYFVEEDEEGDGLILYRRDDGSVDEDLTEGGHIIELARMITALNFTFEDSEGEVFEAWTTLSGEHLNRIPPLVVIRITIRDRGEEERTFTTSVHPALAGGGSAE
jgi:prepilin-type N-terminal cleavage/methylation domain-containing protein